MNNKERIYLAGGLASRWRKKLKSQFSDKFLFYDPKEHLLSVSNLYTVWDLHFVQKCDIIFAYMEGDNPSGYGLTLELGYAKALNKTIILVDERSKHDSEFSKKFDIVKSSASVYFQNIDDGIKYLERFSIYST